MGEICDFSKMKPLFRDVKAAVLNSTPLLRIQMT